MQKLCHPEKNSFKFAIFKHKVISLSKILRMMKKKTHYYCFSCTKIQYRISVHPYLLLNVYLTLVQKKMIAESLLLQLLNFMKLLMSKNVYFHQHKFRYLPVFCLYRHFLLCICHFSFIKLKTQYFLIYLKSKFKSNQCTFQSTLLCLFLHAPSDGKLSFGLVKKWLNTEFPKNKGLHRH